MIFDHTRKVTHDLLLLIRESIAFFFSFFFLLYLSVYIHELNYNQFRKEIFCLYKAMDILYDYYEYHICILQLKGSMYQQAFAKRKYIF